MRITFIVTIDPVKESGLLDLLVHSLNLQTSNDFDVVFFNQTRTSTRDILRTLRVAPGFRYRSFAIHPRHFFGAYAIWDLYAFHSYLLRRDLVGEFVMSLHVEEFLDPDYVAAALQVLGASGLDILFGNLTRTRLDVDAATPLLRERTAADFDSALRACGVSNARHWAFRGHGFRVGHIRRDIRMRLRAGLPFRLRPTRAGYRLARRYCMEDVFLIRAEFAREHNWFLDGYSLPFEDIHICDLPGVCELVPDLVERTRFPVYFDRARIYHVRHRRHYFQLLDSAFTDGMLAMETADPVLCALKEAIAAHRSGQFDLARALRHSRQNPSRTGTQDMNYAYHALELRGGQPRADGQAPMADFVENG